jgi:hypothetical protein
VFEAQGVRVVRTPVQAPQATGIAKRFVRTVRSECLDWLLIWNTQHLEHILKVFVDHYNSRRPHRRLGLVPSNGRPLVELRANGEPINVRRRDRLGGLLHEYERAAWRTLHPTAPYCLAADLEAYSLMSHAKAPILRRGRLLKFYRCAALRFGRGLKRYGRMP